MENNQLEQIAHIKQMMEKSSRFISLSGISGIAAGICALIGAGLARYFIASYFNNYDVNYMQPQVLRNQLIGVALGTFVCALIAAFFFTYQKSKKDGVAILGAGSRKLAWNTFFPILMGAAVILVFIFHKDYDYVAPASLIFYGLGLVNGSKYTLGEVKYIGYINCILGILNFLLPSYSIVLWALGFGVAHILYGIAMWLKYDKQN